jgi:hypothetical protein
VILTDAQVIALRMLPATAAELHAKLGGLRPARTVASLVRRRLAFEGLERVHATDRGREALAALEPAQLPLASTAPVDPNDWRARARARHPTLHPASFWPACSACEILVPCDRHLTIASLPRDLDPLPDDEPE